MSATAQQFCFECQVHKALKDTYEILGELLNSVALDLSSEANDCLEVFDQYEWMMMPGCDATKFQMLKEKGSSGTMTKKELGEFIGMVSREGQIHLYFSIIQGHKAIAEYNEIIRSALKASTPAEEYKVVAMSTGHLTEEDRDALADAVNNGETMILQRETGFFLKLYEEDSPSNYRHGHSGTLKDIIRWAHHSGYRMIEFDGDAEVLKIFPVFDW